MDRLKREIGLGGAILTGLGSILGTGAFVSIALASAMWGDRVLLAIPLAAGIAMFSGLSSAMLAGRFPVAGGTYEYAYETLNPWLGFTAGWVFLLAKTASAATAALGVALYLGMDGRWLPPLVVAILTSLVLAGLRRTTVANIILVGVAITGIVWFIALPLFDTGVASGTTEEPLSSVLAAAAFLFVAFTGFGRVATLGEEVHHPERTIPRAVVVTLLIATVLYVGIAWAGRMLGGARWGSWIRLPEMAVPIRVAAISAMLGVLLNLILGLSRVWLAMGRRGDMPSRLGVLDTKQQPRIAVLLTGILIAATTLIGNIGLTWSFSAMTVLLYYAITNLSAIAVDRTRVSAWLGLASCLFLSVFVPVRIWVLGVAMVVGGLVWKAWSNRMRSVPSP